MSYYVKLGFPSGWLTDDVTTHLKHIRNADSDAEITTHLAEIDALVDDDVLTETDGIHTRTDRGTQLCKFATADHNPTSLDTNLGTTFDILADGDWHCGDCELPGSQPARSIKDLRNHGFEFEQTNRGWCKRLHCSSCGRETTHRRMKYPFPTNQRSLRQTLPQAIRKRIREIHNHKDAITGQTSANLEIDHRRPHNRRDDSESINFDEITDEELYELFQLLSTEHNQLKREKCKKCQKTGERPGGLHGIKHYYKGGEDYTDEHGCEGCFWYNPPKWLSDFTGDSVDVIHPLKT